MRKQPFYLISFLFLLFSVSCKYDVRPTGVFHGTYYGDSLAVPSGEGDLTVTSAGGDYYIIQFTSAGNPDIIINTIALYRQTLFGGVSYYGSDGDYYSPYYVRAYYYEATDNFSFSFRNSAVTVEFDGYE